MIPIALPEIGPEEVAAVNAVLASGMLAQGSKVAAFETAFAKYCGTRHAVAVNSGTAALHAALVAAGVGPGDEVITVPFSFIATINPIIMVGARPVLVDIDGASFNIDVKAVEAAITPATKAIIAVHLYGQPCDWDELSVLADHYNIQLIEDACQAVGATYKGSKTGSLGTLGCFSLYATKNIMCGEGGVVTTDDDAMAARVRSFRQHGMSAAYEYAELGYNYRMSDLQAAIACEQLKKVDRFTWSRQLTASHLTAGLHAIKGIIVPTVAANRTHVYHQYTIRISDDFVVSRDECLSRLRSGGVGASVYYPKPLHAYQHIAAYGYKIGDFPIAEAAAASVLSLPVHPAVTRDDAAKIVASLQDIADGA